MKLLTKQIEKKLQANMDNESLDALVKAITEKVFKHDPVKLEVSFNAHNC